MIFKPYNIDFGITVSGTSYNFDHVQSVSIEDPTMTKLIRGANATNLVGLEYQEGVSDPKIITVVIMGMSAAIHDLLLETFKNKTRCEFFAIDRTDGSNMIAKDAVLSKQPRQATIDATAESMNVELVFESFNCNESHRS